jgi:hypothetical protein
VIEGLTHEKGVLHKITRYKGKISTGYAPNEGPNNTNHPIAAGFFRMLKEVTRSERIGREKKLVNIKEWVINDSVQKDLEKSLPTASTTPRRIEIVCLYKTPEEMWESSVAMYSKSEGLLCKSHGLGTIARYLQVDGKGERTWIDRNGKDGCGFHDCSDFKEGKCKAIGLLKCFPVIDMAPNPYRFETRSINTIIGMESAFQELFSLLTAAHAVKQMEAGKQLPFDGFLGEKLYLIHRKVKSGGRDVYITDLMPTPAFTISVMEPIKRGLDKKASVAKLIGAAGTVSILGEAGKRLLGHVDADSDIESVPMDIEDQRNIAVNFPTTDSDEGEVVATEDDPKVTESDDFKEPDRTGADVGKKVAQDLMGDKDSVPKKNND